LEIDPGEDDHLGVEGGSRHILSIRTDHTASAVEDEFALLACETARNFKIAGQVAAAHNGARRDHETAPFKSVKPAGDLIHLFKPGPERDVNVFPRHVQRLPHEWHPVLPTDQPADTPDGGVNHAQAAAVPLGPDQTLVESRDEFAMDVDQT